MSHSFLTTAEAAKRLDVSPRTVARWVESGRLIPALRLPGKTGPLMFTAEAVEALVEPSEAAS